MGQTLTREPDGRRARPEHVPAWRQICDVRQGRGKLENQADMGQSGERSNGQVAGVCEPWSWHDGSTWLPEALQSWLDLQISGKVPETEAIFVKI